MPACLLFDFFGTLVEYQPNRSALAFQDSHQHLGNHTNLSYERFIRRIEDAFVQLESPDHEFLMEDVGALVVQQAPNHPLVSEFVDAYMREWSADIRMVPGAAVLLSKLSKNYRLGIISNTHHSPTVHRLLDKLAFPRVFETVVLSADIGIPKPAPEIFRHALDILGVPPDETVYIGDSYEQDYKGANSTGIPAYLIGRHARVPRKRQLRTILDLPIHFDIH